jgi:RNA polymerase sigma-70 factor (ECF subfamily)
MDQLDDVVQEVFVVVCNRLDDIASDRERAFVVGITVRVAANWRRSQRRRLEEPWPERDDLPSACDTTTQELCSARRQGLELLDEALACMTEEQRQVFVLVELEQLTAREAGEQLQLQEAAVVSRLRRARESFRQFCERWQTALPVPRVHHRGARSDA